MRVKPKKSLGQNFLVDKNIRNKIINCCQFKESDTVLEIGAGRGELTRLIAEKAGKVYAVEIDYFLSKCLKESFKNNAGVKIINQDILKFNLKKCFGRNKNKSIKVVGNIPYYITTPIIAHLLKFKYNISVIFLTVQKEFAGRMAARPGSKDYGSFSCYVQYNTNPKMIFLIKRTCFFPAPAVDSCFLRLEVRQIPPVELCDEKLFFKIIRGAFSKRRKTLRNSLEGIIPQTKINNFFDKFGIDWNIRPEKLSLQDFANLTNL